MTIKEAVNIFEKKYPSYKVIGYWIQGKDYILNTKNISGGDGFVAPGQFVVTIDGSVYGTNPMLNGLSVSDMKKLSVSL